MSRGETARKFDAIVSFAEVERFIDTPVKRYSSGMYMRLAFSVAAHLEPDILFVDEVLAVGDAAFQRKCLGRMGSIANEGRTVLFVSHNMAAVQSICKRAYLLEKGTIVQEGATHDVVDSFLALITTTAEQSLSERTDRHGSGRLRLTDVALRGSRLSGSENVQSGEDFSVAVGYAAADPGRLSHVNVSVGIYTSTGQCVSVFNNEMAGAEFPDIPRKGVIVCEVNRLPLTPGQYFVNLYCEVNGVLADWVQNAATLTVDPGDFFGTGRLPPASHGGVLLPQHWSIQGGEPDVILQED
jgi:lipopolysaccharide transport system ATP-binding protein